MEILLPIMKIWCDKICMSRIIGDIVWTMNHLWFMKSVYVHFLLCSNSSSFLLFFPSSSQVFKFCDLHQAQNLTFGHLFNQLLLLPLIFFLLLVSRLIGCIIFYSEFFPCWFWHSSSPCWCWHSPWCSWRSSSPCYYCCSFEWLLLATLVIRVVLATFAIHILLSIIANLTTCLFFCYSRRSSF